jgi:Mycothiol maleylpyruvate isomerase N-terminal domain
VRSLPSDIRGIGWLAAHLLVHIRGAYQELASAFADPTDEPADRGYPDIWKQWQPGDQAPSYSDVKYYWASAAAYGGGDELRRHLADRARVAAAASRNAPRGRFRTLGHSLTDEDILAVWTVELVVHQMDLRAGTPTTDGTALTVWTLDGLTGGRVSSWDDYTYIGKATGREPLTSADRDVLLERAVEFPAFG